MGKIRLYLLTITVVFLFPFCDKDLRKPSGNNFLASFEAEVHLDEARITFNNISDRTLDMEGFGMYNLVEDGFPFRISGTLSYYSGVAEISVTVTNKSFEKNLIDVDCRIRYITDPSIIIAGDVPVGDPGNIVPGGYFYIGNVSRGNNTALDVWVFNNVTSDFRFRFDVYGNISEREIFVTNTAVDGRVLVFNADGSGDLTPIRRLMNKDGLWPRFIDIDPVNNEIFVPSFQSVRVYRMTDSGNPFPVREIKGPDTTLSFPIAVAVDVLHNELFVLDGKILVFDRNANGNVLPRRTISFNPSWGIPEGIAIDLVNDEIYVTFLNYLTVDDSVAVYNRTWSGNPSSKRRIYGIFTGLADPHGIAIDGDYILVANGRKISFFHRLSDGNVPPLKTLYTIVDTLGITVDILNNEIFITDYNGTSITVYSRYAQDGDPPIRTISGSNTQLNSSYGIAVDNINDEIFVSNFNEDSINVYNRTDAGNVSPKRVITDPRIIWISYPAGIKIDKVNHEVFIADGDKNRNAILVYNDTDSGLKAPKRIISGPATSLAAPYDVAVDSVNDVLYVLNSWPIFSITCYPRNASGNVAPLREITGNNTGLLSAKRFALDIVNGEIFVANASNKEILVFKTDDNGDIPPLRRISGSNTTLFFPYDIEVDPVANEIFVIDSDNSVKIFSRDGNGDIPPLRVLYIPDLPEGVSLDFVNNEIAVITYSTDYILFYPRTGSGDIPPLREIGGPNSGITDLIGVDFY